MNEIPVVNVNDWYDVMVVALIVVSGWITTLITIYMGQKKAHASHADLHSKVDEVKQQVANGHTTPLRQDMDEMRGILQIIWEELHTIRRDIHSVHSDMTGIREELGVERTARTDLEHRLDDELGPRP